MSALSRQKATSRSSTIIHFSRAGHERGRGARKGCYHAVLELWEALPAEVSRRRIRVRQVVQQRLATSLGTTMRKRSVDGGPRQPAGQKGNVGPVPAVHGFGDPRSSGPVGSEAEGPSAPDDERVEPGCISLYELRALNRSGDETVW